MFCKNCNGIEGKIKNLVVRGRGYRTSTDFLKNLLEYWEYYSMDRTGLLHPVHLTPAEKIVKRKVRAKKLRAAKKG